MRLVDQHDGIKTWFEYDDLTDHVTIKTTQDVNAHVEQAKQIRGKNQTKDKSLAHQASVPAIIWLKWFQEEGLVFSSIKDIPREERRKIYRKKLHGDYSQFRVGEGRF